MKVIARSLVVIFVALIAVPALAVSYTIATAVQLLATTALIMGGTDHPLSNPPDSDGFVLGYMDQAVNNFIDPDGAPVPPNPATINRVAVIYPAEFFPVFGSTTFDDTVAAGRDNLHLCLQGSDDCNFNTHVDSTPPAVGDHFIVLGYSTSAVVASLVENDLINGAAGPDTAEFFLISNNMRPNGGILARDFEGMTIPLIGITFYGPTENSCPTADPCAGPYPTVDVAQQYDFLGGDASARLDPLAFANSIAADALLHGAVPSHSLNDPTIVDQGEYGDTHYYLITAPRLPLLMLAEQAGVPGPVLAIPDALLRVWIEDKYRRDLSPGEHVPFQLSPIGNPINLVGNMLGAIPVGIDDTVQQAGGPRVLGTADVYRPFGVGGPVYNKTTGEESTDSNIVPLTSARNSFDAQKSVLPGPTAPEPPQTGETQELKKNQNPDLLANVDMPGSTSAPEGTKPRPLRELFRGPIKFDPPQRPSAVRQNGDGPLKRIVNALTGQRPDPAGEPGPGGDKKPTEGEQPAA